MNINSIYRRRNKPDIVFRMKMWKLLCHDFFQKYIPEDGSVLEIGAGFCEFINNIRAKNKIALDINPDIKIYAAPDVKLIISRSDSIQSIPDSSISVVFISNFFEHLERDSIIATIHEVHRILLPEGIFIILQPNIRYCSKDYWMFFDHITPIDDRALVEILEINQFSILSNIRRFLPYTTKSSFPKSLFLLSLYLKLKFSWLIFGQQALIISKRTLLNDHQ